MTRVIGLIAVRMKSRRLPKKALLKLNGKPMIVRLYERLLLSKGLSEVIICTSIHRDDDPIEKIANRYDMAVFRGHEDDVMERFLDCLIRNPAEHIVRITGDNPVTDPQIIDMMVDSHLENKADYTRMNDLPVGVSSEVIRFSALLKAYELAEDSRSSEYMTWYFTKSDCFKLNILKAPNHLARPDYRLTVDYPEDFEVMEAIFKEFDFDFFPPAISKIIEYLDNNPELVKTNSNIQNPIDLSIVNTRLKSNRQ